MKNNKEEYWPLELRSKTMYNFFSDLDDRIARMEETIDYQNKEIKELNGEIAENVNRNLDSGKAMIANVLMSALGGGRAMDASTGVMLVTIRDMENMDQVRAYIKQIGDNTLEHLNKEGA